MACSSSRLFIWILCLVVAACGRGVERDSGETAGTAAGDSAGTRYSREFTFLAPGEPEPLVVLIAFGAHAVETELARDVRGWLATGATWDRFVEASGETSAAGGFWKVVPWGDFRITVGGPAEIESMRFERGDRRLRLELDSLLTGWNQGGTTRFRLIEGRLTLGSEILSGFVLERLRIERILEDGWPPDQDFDAVFLTSGDSIQLVLSEALSGAGGAGSYSWIRRGGEERGWAEGEIRWLDVRRYEEARREVPTRWSLRIPSAGLSGELAAAGFDVVLGPERGGRRALEMRYTVSGWFDLDGRRHTATGTIRHTQQ
jgi:hypothetical protein